MEDGTTGRRRASQCLSKPVPNATARLWYLSGTMHRFASAESYMSCSVVSVVSAIAPCVFVDGRCGGRINDIFCLSGEQQRVGWRSEETKELCLGGMGGLFPTSIRPADTLVSRRYVKAIVGEGSHSRQFCRLSKVHRPASGHDVFQRGIGRQAATSPTGAEVGA